MRVASGSDAGDDVQPECSRRRIDNQLLVFNTVSVAGQRFAVDGDALQFEPLAIEHQRAGRVALAAYVAARGDQRLLRIQ